MYIYIYIHTYICIERERKRKKNIYIYIHTHVCICLCIFVDERRPAAPGPPQRRGTRHANIRGHAARPPPPVFMFNEFESDVLNVKTC